MSKENLVPVGKNELPNLQVDVSTYSHFTPQIGLDSQTMLVLDEVYTKKEQAQQAAVKTANAVTNIETYISTLNDDLVNERKNRKRGDNLTIIISIISILIALGSFIVSIVKS